MCKDVHIADASREAGETRVSSGQSFSLGAAKRSTFFGDLSLSSAKKKHKAQSDSQRCRVREVLRRSVALEPTRMTLQRIGGSCLGLKARSF